MTKKYIKAKEGHTKTRERQIKQTKKDIKRE
jgi:hypothetical protein